MAVVPIARPARKRRTSAFMALVRTGDAGCSSSAEKAQAEIMKMPRQRPSIMYSGQCCVNACFALSVQCLILAWAATGSSSSCAANHFTAVAGVHWNSLLMCGGIQRSIKGYGLPRKFLAKASLLRFFCVPVSETDAMFYCYRESTNLIQSCYPSELV